MCWHDWSGTSCAPALAGNLAWGQEGHPSQTYKLSLTWVSAWESVKINLTNADVSEENIIKLMRCGFYA